MDRCWLRGSEGDALHAVLCAAGFNIRWLLRAIARKGLFAATVFMRWLTSILSVSPAESLMPFPSSAAGGGNWNFAGPTKAFACRWSWGNRGVRLDACGFGTLTD